MRIIFVTYSIILFVCSAVGNKVDDYPTKTLQCYSSLTVPDRRLICPAARFAFCWPCHLSRYFNVFLLFLYAKDPITVSKKSFQRHKIFADKHNILEIVMRILFVNLRSAVQNALKVSLVLNIKDRRIRDNDIVVTMMIIVIQHPKTWYPCCLLEWLWFFRHFICFFECLFVNTLLSGLSVLCCLLVHFVVVLYILSNNVFWFYFWIEHNVTLTSTSQHYISIVYYTEPNMLGFDWVGA
jgi:hypothetical protein